MVVRVLLTISFLVVLSVDAQCEASKQFKLSFNNPLKSRSSPRWTLARRSLLYLFNQGSLASHPYRDLALALN